MSNANDRVFDLPAGLQSEKMWVMFGMVVLGIIAHWVWEVAVAVIGSGQEWDFGSNWVIVARVVVAVIAGLVNFAGIWKQLENVDPKVRVFSAFTQGFAIDALVAPVAHNI